MSYSLNFFFVLSTFPYTERAEVSKGDAIALAGDRLSSPFVDDIVSLTFRVIHKYITTYLSYKNKIFYTSFYRLLSLCPSIKKIKYFKLNIYLMNLSEFLFLI